MFEKACELLYTMLKDWNWQTKEAPVVSLIRALVEIDDDGANERIHAALMGNFGFLKVLLSGDSIDTRQHGGHNQQYDVYSTRTLVQRYQDMLKNLCAIQRVQEYVSEKSSKDENYHWLHNQIILLLRGGHINPQYLKDELRRTFVEVSGAGEVAVNGMYRFDRLRDMNTSLYKMDTTYRNKPVTFQIYRCRLNDQKTYQWFISIVPQGKEPGTNQDEDFYFRVSTFKATPNYQVNTTVSLSDGNDDIKPPEGQWFAMPNFKSKPAPTITWVVNNQPPPPPGDDIDSDKEDSMAVIEDEDRFTGYDDLDDEDDV